ncbi:MAG: motility associated factor glycosyltransferase family protein [Alphaproteobacteria bacterium]|nr:motility associated factor glycosyltransferase family protein [Alphaproteobacteria bacterium]MBL6945305.1 motility associated factor glycosyltransferase family protein [Rhodospirillales bacterium]
MKDQAAVKNDFFENNLAAFETKFPIIHKALSQISEPHSRLIYDENGESDIEFQGTRLYETGSKSYAEKQVTEYWRNPFRVNFSPPDSKSLDRVAGSFTYRTMKRAVEAGMTFTPVSTSKESFFLFVFGVGLGGHIEPMVEATKCRGLFIVEPNLEFIHHSLFVFDWVALFDRFSDDEKFILLSVGTDYKKISHDVRNFVRGSSVSFFDGALTYSHYPNSVMEMARQRIQADASLFMSGLGFLEDEFVMVGNSFKNLKDYDSYIYKRNTKQRSLPTFVIGSGPSIDKCFDVIRANQDNAVIISCGTALGVLLANGIVPDFQVEMERVEVVYDILSGHAENYDISDVCLVATTTIDPRVPPLFSKKVLYFRKGLSSWDIFSPGEEASLVQVSPIVANAGFSFALETGSREIYLFGVDCGSRQHERHHADQSEYRPGGKVEWGQRYSIERPGNFGGSVHTHEIFVWSRENLEGSIRAFKRGLTCYNCSDGMAIDGAVPKVPKAVSLPEASDKAAELEGIFNGFTLYSREEFDRYWGARNWPDEIEKICDQLIELCDEKDDDYPLRYVVKMYKALTQSSDRGEAAELLMIRGSIFMIMITVGYYYSRLVDRDREQEFLELLSSELKVILGEIRDETVAFFHDLEP